MKAFVINMDKDTERLNKITNRCKEINIEFERFKGIDSNDFVIYNEYISEFAKKYCSDSIIGCGLSHILLWKKIVDENIDQSLILEDDAIFKENFNDNLKKGLDDLNNTDWNILYLTETYIHNKNLYKEKLEDKLVYKSLFINTTSGYIITNKGAKELLKHIKKIYYHIDFTLLLYNLFNDLKIYSLKTPIIYQTFTSDNSNNIIYYNYPYNINKLLDQIDDKNNENIKLSYLYNLKLIKIFNIEITLNIILIVLLGYINFKYSLLFLLYEYYIYNYNIDELELYFVLLIIGFIIKKMII